MGPAVATPKDALAVIFKLHDWDENGSINKYEWVQMLIIQAEADVSVMDLWRQTSEAFYNMDFNMSGDVDENEFVMSQLYELVYALSNEIENEAGVPI